MPYNTPVHKGIFFKMDVKYNTIVNITLSEDDIKELKEELFKIYGFWDKHNGEVSEKYVGTILAKLWHSL